MSPAVALALGALGLLIGLLVGATSIGGVLLVPALVFVWGIEVHAAVATSMASFMLGGLVAALLFGRHGSVNSVAIITDRITGRSRGFGLVEMSDAVEGKAAMEAVNGQEIDGRTLKVNEARERVERGATR